MSAAAAAAPPAWIQPLADAEKADATSVSKYERATEVLLATFPTREHAEAKGAQAQIQLVIARARLSVDDLALYDLKGVRGLPEDVQKAKEFVTARVRKFYGKLLDKFLYPESATKAVDGAFWRRNPTGFGVTAVERVLPQVAGKKRGAAGAHVGAGASESTLDKIAAYGVLGPSALWRIHDSQGNVADGCGGWVQFRFVFAAPSDYGKTYLARTMLKYRLEQMRAEERGVPTYTIDVWSSSGTGWADIAPEKMRRYNEEEIEQWLNDAEAFAQEQKARGLVPPLKLIILDDIAGERGVEKNRSIDSIFSRGRHANICIMLLGQSPKGLVSPFRKTNTTLYCFGNFPKYLVYNEDFARMAEATDKEYKHWTAAHFGKKNGYRFGAEFKEAVGEQELPFILATATEQLEPEMPEVEMSAPPQPKQPKPAAGGAGSAPKPLDEEIDEDSDDFDYAGEQARLSTTLALLQSPSASSSAAAAPRLSEALVLPKPNYAASSLAAFSFAPLPAAASSSSAKCSCACACCAANKCRNIVGVLADVSLRENDDDL
jgi:hypothetical protein